MPEWHDPVPGVDDWHVYDGVEIGSSWPEPFLLGLTVLPPGDEAPPPDAPVLAVPSDATEESPAEADISEILQPYVFENTYSATGSHQLLLWWDKGDGWQCVTYGTAIGQFRSAAAYSAEAAAEALLPPGFGVQWEFTETIAIEGNVQTIPQFTFDHAILKSWQPADSPIGGAYLAVIVQDAFFLSSRFVMGSPVAGSANAGRRFRPTLMQYPRL